MCKVNPSNIGMLYSLAVFFLLVVLLSILSGKTYCKCLITRRDEPFSFWITVSMYFILGGGILIGISVCQ